MGNNQHAHTVKNQARTLPGVDPCAGYDIYVYELLWLKEGPAAYCGAVAPSCGVERTLITCSEGFTAHSHEVDQLLQMPIMY